MRKIGTFFLMIICYGSWAQTHTDQFLRDLLWNHGSAQLKTILEHPDSFRYQIIYTKIDRDEDGNPHFQPFYYRVNKDDYFNPASTVKMPLAFLALEKINSMKKYGLNKYSSMLTDSAYAGQVKCWQDSSSADGLPSLAQYIRKMFLVSDNDAYNRLYEFLGQAPINQRLWEMGYHDIRITRRFVPMDEDQNRHTNPIRFMNKEKLLFEQPAAYSDQQFDFSKRVLFGHAHLDAKDSLVQEPMDFTRHNKIPLQDLQKILQSVLFPESVPAISRFALKDDDYSFLYQYMSEYPSESLHPRYDTSEYYDSYTKFFLFKSDRTAIPSNIRIFNKPGWSYGFLTDVAYIADFKNKVEFMLSAVIYVNRDGILNDDKYEYEETGYPFFKDLGDIIYRYELGRKREHLPDLKRFQLHYE